MPVAVRRCACGCGASIAGKRSDARYASDACRLGAWKAQHSGTAENGYLERSRAAVQRSDTRTSRSGKQVAYGRALDAGVRIAQMARLDLTASPEVIARQEMSRALPARQRAELDRRAQGLGR